MVTIQHKGENTEKVRDILKTASKWFGLYGLEKTSMREIAADLGMSKASLYYYFPDKETLFLAVVRSEQADFLSILNAACEKITDPRKKLRQYVELRQRYFQSFLNITKLRLAEYETLKPFLTDIFKELKTRENEFISAIIKEGNEKKIFFHADPNEMAQLFIGVLKGIRHTLFHRHPVFPIKTEDYAHLEKLTNAFVRLFLRALENPEDDSPDVEVDTVGMGVK